MMVKGLLLSNGTPAPPLADPAHLAGASAGHLPMLHAAKCSQPRPADPRVEDLMSDPRPGRRLRRCVRPRDKLPGVAGAIYVRPTPSMLALHRFDHSIMSP
jgi:hypothetical protein